MSTCGFRVGYSNALRGMAKRAAGNAPAQSILFTPTTLKLPTESPYYTSFSPMKHVKDWAVDGVKSVARTGVDTVKALGDAAKGVGNVAANAVLYGKYDPNYSPVFGYSNPGGRAATWDAAVAAPVAGIDAFSGNVVNGVSRIADVPVKALGYNGFSDEIEASNRDSHSRLRDSLYWDDRNKNSEQYRDAEDIYSELAQLGTDYLSGGASQWIPLLVETSAQAGKTPSYSTTHDAYGRPTQDDMHENTANDWFTGLKFMYPWAANISNGGLPQLPGWLVEATPGTLAGESAGSTYDYIDTHNAAGPVLQNQRNHVNSMTMFADAINTQKDIQGYIGALMSGDLDGVDEIRKRRPELFGSDGTLNAENVEAARQRYADAGVPDEFIRRGEFGAYPVSDQLHSVANEFADASIDEKQQVAAELDARMKADLAQSFAFGGIAATEQVLASLPAAKRMSALRWLASIFNRSK